MVGRRAFILGLTSALAAPAIVRAESLMKLWVPPKIALVNLNEESLLSLILSLPPGALKQPGQLFIHNHNPYPMQVMANGAFKFMLQPGERHTFA